MPTDLAAHVDESQRPLRRREYDVLVELGCFADERVELLYGRIMRKSPQGVAEAEALRRLNRLLQRGLADRAEVQTQLPLAAVDESEPEPDVAVVPPGPYTTDHPSQAHLVVEVADSSLRRDRLKAELYAASGIPEYWVVDLKARTIQVQRDPVEGAYRRINSFSDGESVPLQAFPDVVLGVSEVLPPG